MIERAFKLGVGIVLAILIACEPLPGTGADGGAASSEGGSGSCALEGQYVMQATQYKASGGTYCNKLLTELSATTRAGETLVFTKIDATTYQSKVVGTINPGLSWTLDTSTCQLRNTSSDVVDSTDSAGAPVKVKLDGLTFAKLDGTTLTITSSSSITSATQGAQGFPCQLDSSQTGTKK